MYWREELSAVVIARMSLGGENEQSLLKIILDAICQQDLDPTKRIHLP
jgi:hypothetical protein